jgi:hypothetical protein
LASNRVPIATEKIAAKRSLAVADEDEFAAGAAVGTPPPFGVAVSPVAPAVLVAKVVPALVSYETGEGKEDGAEKEEDGLGGVCEVVVVVLNRGG